MTSTIHPYLLKRILEIHPNRRDIWVEKEQLLKKLGKIKEAHEASIKIKELENKKTITRKFNNTPFL